MHRSVRDADVLDYSALVLPGGVVNADELRTVPAAVNFVQRIFEAGNWVDTEVQVCTSGPNTIVSSRKPGRSPPLEGRPPFLTPRKAAVVLSALMTAEEGWTPVPAAPVTAQRGAGSPPC